MQITIFSIMMSVFWMSIFSVILRKYGTHPTILSLNSSAIFIIITFFRIFFPFELSGVLIVRSKFILPIIYKILFYPFIQTNNGTVVLCLAYCIILILITIAAVLLYKRITAYKELYRILDNIPPTDDEFILSTLNNAQKLCCKRKKVKIITNKGIATPAVIGLFSPILILPESIFDEDELLGILVHELTHLYQKHCFFMGTGIIIQTLFWWNPLCKYLNDELAYILELYADKKVKNVLNKQQQSSYLNAIVKVVKNQREISNSIPFANCLVEKNNKNSIEQRFKLFLEDVHSTGEKRKSKLLIGTGCALLILSYSFILQPYVEPNMDEYGTGIVISESDYLIKASNGYDLYSKDGKYIGNLTVSDNNLKELKMQTK